ncbi:cell division protein FtsL [Camelliibacillus cellulosilyticus]|uniref:Cell division protein FtsL n=1 Tax=Camelliibacillus cellulosilyticus TaxID=2174486 RepID=A0ABV9GJ45_9BACL
MGQPARRMIQEREQVAKRTTIAVPGRKITKGEKVLWTLGILTVLVLSLFIISNQAKIYLENRAVNSIQGDLAKVRDANNKLNVEITQLSDPKRIMEYAKKHGFHLDVNQVKVIK